MRTRTLSVVFFATGLLWLGTIPTQAQTRVFVAAQGSDANPCTFALPCRTFQHAHDTVAAGGEINVLDPAGYGALIISKAISIQGHGYAEITVSTSGGIAITINAGSTDSISLRGLLMDGVGTAIGGVDFLRGGSLSIQDCLIRRFSNGDGIRFEPGVSSRLSVQNTIISESGNGIFILPNGAAVVVVLDSITADGNAAFGVFGSGSSASIALTVINSTITNNALGGGIDLEASSGGTISAFVRESTLAKNWTGLRVNSSPGSMDFSWITRSSITGNGTGLSAGGGGSIVSFGDNSIAGNTTDGAPTSTITLK